MAKVVAQLVLLHAGLSELPKQLSGSYVGPVYPEAPALRHPGQALRQIGLEKYRHPFYGWVDEKNMQDR